MSKPADHTKRPPKSRVYVEYAGFRRGVFTPIQLTSWDSRRDKTISTLRRIIDGEKLQAQFRKYYLKARIA